MSDPLVSAITSTWAATTEVLRSLSAEDWDRPTGCPGWTVRDQASHMIWSMHLHAGRDEPERDLPDLPHLGNPMADYMERAVEARRGRPGAEVLAEYEAGRDEASAALDGADLDDVAPGPMGHDMPRRSFLTISVFDQWAHGQDIRRAVGRSGDLDSAAADVSLSYVLATSLPRLLPERLPELARGSIAFDLTDPARDASVGEGEQLVGLHMSTEVFAALVCGRADALGVGAPVEMSGDAALGQAVLRSLSVTP